jgi:hypothetical protein
VGEKEGKNYQSFFQQQGKRRGRIFKIIRNRIRLIRELQRDIDYY